MYLALFLILRFAMVQRSSTIGLADILVIVVIADAAQSGFAKEYKPLTEGTFLVLTIVFWDFLLNFLSYRFKSLERIFTPPPLSHSRHRSPVRADSRVVRADRKVVSTKAARTVNRKWPRFGGAFLETSIDAWEGKMLPFPWSPGRPLSRERDLFPGTRFHPPDRARH
jgi:hypothetical protein